MERSPPLHPDQEEYWKKQIQRLRESVIPDCFPSPVRTGLVEVGSTEAPFTFVVSTEPIRGAGFVTTDLQNVLRGADHSNRPVVLFRDATLSPRNRALWHGFKVRERHKVFPWIPAQVDGEDYLLVPNSHPKALWGPWLRQLDLERYDGQRVRFSPIHAPFGLVTRLTTIMNPRTSGKEEGRETGRTWNA